MAYKIIQFVANNNLSGIGTDRSAQLTGATGTILRFPTIENVNVKKIAVDCVYNSPGDLIVSDYALAMEFFSISNQLSRSDRPILINPASNLFAYNQKTVQLRKNNPIINLNEYLGGLSISTTQIVLSNTTTPILSNISLLISVYYVE